MKNKEEQVLNTSDAAKISKDEMPKSCSHGKGLNDYCEPCGRINGG